MFSCKGRPTAFLSSERAGRHFPGYLVYYIAVYKCHCIYYQIIILVYIMVKSEPYPWKHNIHLLQGATTLLLGPVPYIDIVLFNGSGLPRPCY